MRQIIVPTDFSKGAWNALVYATRLGEALGVREILILNAYSAPHAGASTIGSIDRVMQQDSENGLRELTGKIKEAGMTARFNFHSKSIHAGLVEALNSQVTDYNDRLIVMGSLGESGTVEQIFGSNASDVAQKVHCPVIVVPPNAKYTGCRNLVLGSDFEELESSNLQILRTLHLLDPSTNLQIVHVFDKYHPGKLSMKVAQEDLPHSVLEIPGDDVSSAIDRFVSNNPTDLLVLIKKERGFLENLFHTSITKKLTLLGHVPLLVLKRIA